MAPKAAVYKVWKLVCDKCGLKKDALNWEADLPTHCLCGGRYVYADQAQTKMVGLSQREQILASIGELE
jgi:hypothetical protein